MTETYAKFKKEMRESYTILVPAMLPIHFQLFLPIFKRCGYHIEVLKNDGDAVREEGLKHVHNDTCYPALLVIGQFIDALKSGKYDLDHVALAITQTYGGCRASNYLPLLRKALAQEGFEYIPCLSVNVAGLEKDSGLELTVPMIIRVLYGILYGDALLWLKNQVQPYEKNKGQTKQVVQELIDELIDHFEQDTYRNARAIYRTMIARFKNIPQSQHDKIRIGVVGEIYMKYSPLGNQNLEEYIIDEGFEPVVTGVMDFGLYCLENGLIDHAYYHRHEKSYPMFSLAKNIIMHMQRTFIDCIQNEGTFRAPEDFNEVIQKGKSFIDPGVKMGEGWLLTSEVVTLIESGVTDIISAQPFGCLPNHIVAKGMVHKIKMSYPQANVVAIDYDPSASKVNQENRIRLMMANAKLTAQERGK